MHWCTSRWPICGWTCWGWSWPWFSRTDACCWWVTNKSLIFAVLMLLISSHIWMISRIWPSLVLGCSFPFLCFRPFFWNCFQILSNIRPHNFCALLGSFLWKGILIRNCPFLCLLCFFENLLKLWAKSFYAYVFLGISRSAKGYSLISILETLKTFSVEDGLTEEALDTKLRTCRCHYLFLHASLKHNSSGLRPFSWILTPIFGCFSMLQWLYLPPVTMVNVLSHWLVLTHTRACTNTHRYFKFLF